VVLSQQIISIDSHVANPREHIVAHLSQQWLAADIPGSSDSVDGVTDKDLHGVAADIVSGITGGASYFGGIVEVRHGGVFGEQVELTAAGNATRNYEP